MGRGEEQQEFNWTFLQRREWIRDAKIGHGKSQEGKYGQVQRGVSEKTQKDVLHAINERYGENQCAWPSIETLAADTGISTRQIKSAINVLVNRSLLSVVDRERKVGIGSYNEYRIIWTELQIREPSRREAWLRMLFSKNATEQSDMVTEQSDMVTEQSDMVTEQSDMVTEQSDMVTDQSDTMSPKQLTNNSQNKPINNSPLLANDEQSPAAATEPLDDSTSWKVVVRDLFFLKMRAAPGAVSAAKSRGLTPKDIRDLIERWERLRARQPDRVTIGWLYRWIIGASHPEDAEEAEKADTAQRQTSITSPTTHRENARAKIVKRMRAAGASEAEMEAAVQRAWSQMPPPTPINRAMPKRGYSGVAPEDRYSNQRRNELEKQLLAIGETN